MDPSDINNLNSLLEYNNETNKGFDLILDDAKR